MAKTLYTAEMQMADATYTPDPLAAAVKAAWAAHAATLGSKDERAITEAYIAVLRAELALEQDCLAHCTQPATRGVYRATIADLEYQIADEVANLAKLSK